MDDEFRKNLRQKLFSEGKANSAKKCADKSVDGSAQAGYGETWVLPRVINVEKGTFFSPQPASRLPVVVLDSKERKRIDQKFDQGSRSGRVPCNAEEDSHFN